MVALVSQAEAARQLRLVEAALSPDQITDLMFKADQASAIVVDYLKRPFIDVLSINPLATGEPGDQPGERIWTDQVPPPLYLPGVGVGPPLAPSVPPEPGDPWTAATVPVLVKGVILIVLTALYDGRTPEDALLSPQVTAVLERMRDPALA